MSKKVFVASIAMLVGSAIALGNMHGVTTLSDAFGISGVVSTVAGVMAASITVILAAMYILRTRRSDRFMLHVFSGFLMVVAVSAYIYQGELAAASASGSVDTVDAQIAAKQREQYAKQAELDTLANTAVGGNLAALRRELSAAKAVVFRGVPVWDLTKGCTVQGHPKDCGRIVQARQMFEDELARVAGAQANALRTALVVVDGELAKLTADKNAAKASAKAANFVTAVLGQGVAKTAALLLFVGLFAALWERSAAFAFGAFADEFNPDHSVDDNKKAEAGQGIEAVPVIGQLYADHKERKLRAALVKAAAEGKELAKMNPEAQALEAAKVELAKETAIVRRDIATHIAHMTDAEVGTLVDNSGYRAGEKVDKFALKVLLHAAVKLYQPGAAIVQNGNAPMYEQLTTTVDVDGEQVKFECSKHKLATLILPAMESAGFVERVGKSCQWVSEDAMWAALGVGQDAEVEAPAQPRRKPAKVETPAKVIPSKVIPRDKSKPHRGFDVIEGGKH